ncbi:MAG: 30S ribosomal protein S4e [Candidatus Woesearchaeota archaeon]
MSRYFKRITAPRSWKVQRKTNVFLLRPHPGAHSLERGLPLAIILRDYLGYAKNLKEAKMILQTKNVLVDNERRKSEHFLAGLLDVITIKETKEHFRLILNKKGHLELLKIADKEAGIKPKKILNKTVIKKGVLQLNLSDGTNQITKEQGYKTGDTILVEFPQKIVAHYKLANEAAVYITGGKHQGERATVEGISEHGIMCKTEHANYVAQKKHVFVIGDKQPCITLGK